MYDRTWYNVDFGTDFPRGTPTDETEFGGWEAHVLRSQRCRKMSTSSCIRSDMASAWTTKNESILNFYLLFFVCLKASFDLFTFPCLFFFCGLQHDSNMRQDYCILHCNFLNNSRFYFFADARKKPVKSTRWPNSPSR